MSKIVLSRYQLRKIKAANRAIGRAGGAAELARSVNERLQEMRKHKQLVPADEIDTIRVLKWADKGVPSEFIAIVSNIVGMTAHSFDPLVFPAGQKLTDRAR